MDFLFPETSAGCAPEVGQARVKAQLEAEAAENPQPTPDPELEFWVPISGKSEKLTSSAVQAYIYENKLQELKVCPVGATVWVDAKEHNFQYPEVPEDEKTEVLPLGSPSTPEEEKLETYPDDELVTMANLNKVQVPLDENNNVIRPQLIKLLVPFIQT